MLLFQYFHSIKKKIFFTLDLFLFEKYFSMSTWMNSYLKMECTMMVSELVIWQLAVFAMRVLLWVQYLHKSPSGSAHLHQTVSVQIRSTLHFHQLTPVSILFLRILSCKHFRTGIPFS